METQKKLVPEPGHDTHMYILTHHNNIGALVAKAVIRAENTDRARELLSNRIERVCTVANTRTVLLHESGKEGIILVVEGEGK